MPCHGQSRRDRRVAAIVPALNEAQRIGKVLEVLRQSESVGEVIVVDDGSTDATLAQIPSGNGTRAIRHEQNSGKGAALLTGATASQSELLLFLDADLIGLTSAHVEALVRPLMLGDADMAVALFQGGRWRTDWAQRLAPNISGQRALRRDFFLSLPGLANARYSIETVITAEARARGLRVTHVPWRGVTHVLKEEKLGFAGGTFERVRMYRQIAAYRLHRAGLRLSGRLAHRHATSEPSPVRSTEAMPVSRPAEE